MYSLAVAGFVMLGAKLGQRFGATRVFRIVVALFGSAQVLMTFSPVATVMLAAQGLAGLAAAVIVPALVALIANHYRGQQQADGRRRAGLGARRRRRRGVPDRRHARHLHRLAPGLRAPDRGLGDRVLPELQAEAGRGPAGCRDRPRRRGAGGGSDHPDQLRLQQPQPLGPRRGAARRTLRPPRPVAGTGDDRRSASRSFRPSSPGRRRQQAAGKTPLLDLRVITSGQERAAVFALFAVVALEAMLNFSVPLYIQIIQGRTPIETAIAMLPFNLTVFFTAMLVVRLYDQADPAAHRAARLRRLHRGPPVARLGRAQRLERAPSSCSG